jgi:hypothetical protein
MQIALMDECRRLRYCEVEDTPEVRFTLVIQGFCYIFERREDADDGTPIYYLVDAEKDDQDGMGRAS